jgi:hypothetical protein
MQIGLVGKPEGKSPLGRRRHKWEDSIKLDAKEIVWKGMDWINVAQDRGRWWPVVNMVMNLQVRSVLLWDIMQH